jgi:hypothetical protein
VAQYLAAKGETSAMGKEDFKKDLKPLYQPPSKEVVRIEVPAMNFLMVDGEGDPNTSQQFKDAVEALFSLSYTLKFMVKKGPKEVDYAVMPLEGLWWSEDMSTFTGGDKSQWKWTLMIMQPKHVTRNLVETAIVEVKKKKNPVALPKARFEAFSEGLVAQTMYIGPFSEEGPTVQRVHDFIDGCGCKRSGKHHEIYLSDIRRADPKKWKTIVRQPMVRS